MRVQSSKSVLLNTILRWRPSILITIGAQVPYVQVFSNLIWKVWVRYAACYILSAQNSISRINVANWIKFPQFPHTNAMKESIPALPWHSSSFFEWHVAHWTKRVRNCSEIVKFCSKTIIYCSNFKSCSRMVWKKVCIPALT